MNRLLTSIAITLVLLIAQQARSVVSPTANANSTPVSEQVEEVTNPSKGVLLSLRSPNWRLEAIARQEVTQWGYWVSYFDADASDIFILSNPLRSPTGRFSAWGISRNKNISVDTSKTWMRKALQMRERALQLVGATTAIAIMFIVNIIAIFLSKINLGLACNR